MSTVTVFMFGRKDFRARCSCAWEARPRRRMGRAKFDAHTHAAHTGCFTNYPLVRLRDGRALDVRSWRMPWWPWLGMFSIILGGSVYFSSAPAHADIDLTATQFAYVHTYGVPVICPVIDQHHSIDGLVGVTRGVMTDGFTALEAAQIVTSSVITYCPRNIGLIQELIAAGQAGPGQVI